MSGYTPMIEQYLQIKNQYQDAILFFRLGDFYEMFFEDAIKASRELEIVLTSRDGGQEKVPMCGVPYHAVENYLAKLVSKGHKVAICEQVEDPREARGVVKREVIRIVTPGSILEDIMLDEKRNNYLAAVIESHICALAWADISTGEFRVAEFSGKDGWPKLLSELQRLAPAECLVPEWSSLTPSGGDDQNWLDDITITIDHEPISTDNARRLLLQHFGVNSLEGFGLKDYSSGIQAAAVIIRFLQDKCKTRIDHLRSISTYSKGDYLEMDFSTRRNLELTVSLRENRREGSLLAILDGCLSAPGKRTLRRWIEQPLLDLEEIRLRQDGVEEILTDIELRERLKKLLASVNDLERIAARIAPKWPVPAIW
ncbi:hypothetical protein [Syntrophomonas palmitatica]|uniref:hypothetical protein n=1 Tax=Syntrophomonas palmitatica TaxID=402877 RepID=UPI000A7E3F3A|nr:hypothetical protein [Syntrophomonas palmitatica]